MIKVSKEFNLEGLGIMVKDKYDFDCFFITTKDITKDLYNFNIKQNDIKITISLKIPKVIVASNVSEVEYLHSIELFKTFKEVVCKIDKALK